MRFRSSAMNRILIMLWISTILFAASLNGQEDPREKLQTAIDSALDAIYSECCSHMSVEEKQAEVRRRLEAHYDLDVIIRRAIGRNWGLLEEAEQEKVLELVKQLVMKAYVKGLEGKDRPEVILNEMVRISDKRIEIDSVVTLDGTEVNVTYRLGRMRSGWQIYDIVAENISVVSNYRQQIDDHFRRGDGAELISRLDELLKKELTNEDLKI